MEHNPKFPKPDRSNYIQAEHPDEVVIMQYEGVLADGRPFLAEVWWWDGYKGVTYFFSSRDIDDADKPKILALFAASGEPKIVPPEFSDYNRYGSGLCITHDAQGERMWNFTFHLGHASRVTFKEGGVEKTIILADD